MHIEIGDLVSPKNNSEKIGIVVKKSSVNSAAISQHTKNILSGLFVLLNSFFRKFIVSSIFER